MWSLCRPALDERFGDLRYVSGRRAPEIHGGQLEPGEIMMIMLIWLRCNCRATHSRLIKRQKQAKHKCSTQTNHS